MRTLEIAIMTQAKIMLATIRKGKKDVQAGRTVSHEKTARWLRSWERKANCPCLSTGTFFCFA